MNRREFGKLLTSAILLPSLISLAGKDAKLPAKIKYKGFDCLVSDMPWKGDGVIQIYWSNGKYHNAILVDRDVDWHEVENAVKRNIDRGVKGRKIT